MKRASIVTAALAAAVAVLVGLSLPPAGAPLDPSRPDGTVAGVIHIHTNRSDGRSSPDDVAAAAARAGLKFIVLTDHGDGTRVPDAPSYRHGVLCLDGVEISTSAGHYVAIGLPQAPYPLAGEPRDVVEDVARLGGFGIAAHPDSPKPEFRWGGWAAPFDGIELLNPDSSWRKRVAEPGAGPKLELVERLFSYPFRPAETVASVLGDPGENLARWASLLRDRRVVGLAGADAHAKLSLFGSEPGDNRFSLPIPGYETSFRTLAVHVTPGAPFRGDAVADARALVDGLRAGHAYVAVEALAAPPSFSFTAVGGAGTLGEGDEIVAPDARLTLHVMSNAPPSFTTTVFDGGRVLTAAQKPDITVPVTGAGVYRVEIRPEGRAGGGVPWILSNPIYVRRAPAPPPPEPAPPVSVTSLLDARDLRGWRVEHDPGSNGALAGASGGGAGVTFAYALGAVSGSARPSTALLRELPDGLDGNVRLAFSAHADRPMRVSVQLRNGVAGTPEMRWQRSVYLDAADRAVTIPFGDMRPLGNAQASPDADAVRYLLFVVDPLNTKPGAAGTITLDRVALERR